MLINQQ